MNVSSYECSDCDFAVLGESIPSTHEAAAPPDVQLIDPPLVVTADEPANEQQEQQNPPPAAPNEQIVQFNSAAIDFVLSTGLEEELSDGRLFDNGLSADSESGDASLDFVGGEAAASVALTADGNTSAPEHAADGVSAQSGATTAPLSGSSAQSEAQPLFEAALVQAETTAAALPQPLLPAEYVANSPTAHAGGTSAVQDTAPAPASSASVAPAALAGSPSTDPAAATAALAGLPLRFEGNVGQFDASVDYVVRGAGYEAGLHATGTTFVLTPASSDGTEEGAGDGAVVDVNFVGVAAQAVAVGQQQLAGTTNYLVGNDPASHFTNVVSYGEVSYHDVYSGIDVRYYSSPDRQLEYDFVVAPGADPGQIALSFDGATGADLDAAGNLVLHTAAGDLVQHAPVAYQQDASGARHEVASRFVLAGDGQVSFALGSYDTSRALVIDPTWGYSSYAGGSLEDAAYGIAVDDSGNAYIVGSSKSSNFRGVTGNDPRLHFLGTTPVNQIDAFVAKVNADGTDLVYLTFIGGRATDIGRDIVVNDGNAYITGSTESQDFYTNFFAWQTQRGGNVGSDAFVTRLNQAGDGATFSTYLSGVGNEVGYGITLDNDLNVYVTGYTAGSPTFDPNNHALAPTTIGPGGGRDVFVAKLSFVVLTGAVSVDELYFIGGESDDWGRSIIVDNAANPNIYVTGYTQTPAMGVQPFPTTQGAFRRTGVGDLDAFVLKFNPNNAARWSTPPSSAGRARTTPTTSPLTRTTTASTLSATPRRRPKLDSPQIPQVPPWFPSCWEPRPQATCTTRGWPTSTPTAIPTRSKGSTSPTWRARRTTWPGASPWSTGARATSGSTSWATLPLAGWTVSRPRPRSNRSGARQTPSWPTSIPP